jgi:hypothetical protein
MRWVMLGLGMWVLSSAEAGAATVRLATKPAREMVTLLLGAPPAAMIAEERDLALSQGTTTLELSWGGTRLIADSVQLVPVDPASSLQIRGPLLPEELPQRAQWKIEAPSAMRARLRLTYLMDGLSWEPEYVLGLRLTGELSLSAVAVVRNDTGEDFKGARIDLGLSAPVTCDLDSGETLRIPYLEAAAVNGQRFYLCDASAPDGETTARLDLPNTLDAGLGKAPLPAGRVRLYEGDEGETVFAGELRFPNTPVGATAKLELGTAREISVERRVLVSRQVDARTDARGRLALWNQEDEVAFLVESQKAEDAVLRIAERIEGEWKMLSNSHEFHKIDAEHVEFILPVPAHGKLTVTYKVRRLNILP